MEHANASFWQRLTHAVRFARQVDALRLEEQRTQEARCSRVVRPAASQTLTSGALQAGQPSGLQRVLDALNVLGSTKWCALSMRLYFEPRSLTTRATQAHQRRGADNHGASLEGRRRRGGDPCGSGAETAAKCFRRERALTRRARPQDAPVPSMPAPTFTLHSNNIQQLCYGGKPSVRCPASSVWWTRC